MMKKNIVLVGFMGAGKTGVSRYLAEVLKRPRISTDELIEKNEKRSIVQIFQEAGEDHFRRLEKKIVQELAQQENLIIDCGGGIVLQQENLDQLKKNGILVYLSASPEMVYQRVKNHPQRPLLNVLDPQTKIRKMLEARKFYYEQADFTIDTNHKSVEQTAKEVLLTIGQ